MIYIRYRIKALENLKISGSGNQYDNDYSIGYIPGSTLKGSFIRNYIKDYDITDLAKDETGKKLFFKGGMKFLNAYPVRDEVRTLPLPLCYYTSKDNIKEFLSPYNKHKVINSNLINELDEEINDEHQKIRMAEFCNNDFSGSLVLANVEKVDTLHISKGEQSEGKNSLFRYEAIKEGEDFEAYIAFDGSRQAAGEYISLLQGKTVFLGGSKGSGYGKCSIYDVEIMDSNPEVQDMEYHVDDFNEELYIYTVSDLVSTDEFGQVIAYVDHKILEENLRITNVKLVSSSVETNIVSGYNNKWGIRLPQYKAIKGGSVLKYSFEGNIDSDGLQRLMDEGIGLRREDGFGRIIIKEDFSLGDVYSENKKEDDEIELTDLDEKEQIMLESLFSRIYEEQINKAIDSYIFHISSTIKYKKASSNQIGKLLQNILNTSARSKSEGKSSLKNYLNHLKNDKDGKDRSNKKAFGQLEDIRINGKKLTDYFSEVIDNSDNLEYFISNIANGKPFIINNIGVKIDDEFAYRKTMIMLEKLFRYMLRTEKEA